MILTLFTRKQSLVSYTYIFFLGIGHIGLLFWMKVGQKEHDFDFRSINDMFREATKAFRNIHSLRYEESLLSVQKYTVVSVHNQGKNDYRESNRSEKAWTTPL